MPFHINPLVDFYNTISLRYIVPVGGFDLDQLQGPLELRLSRSKECMINVHLKTGDTAHD